MKTLSCGILVLNPRREILLCHVTGAWHWDIPKGSAEPGETPRAAALRETREECGLDLADRPLLDLGRLAYRRDKDLHLFALLEPPFDAGRCHCSSHFTDAWGQRRPEMDGFEWTPFDRVHRRCARHMGEVLTRTLSLPALLARLLHPADPPATVPGVPARP
jgi:8-oxo-dGTP pyrophosphatase MutT (NUDIX family)